MVSLKQTYSASLSEIPTEQALTEKIDNQTVFCAEQDSQILGTIALDKDFVVGFYTRLQNLGQGIGRLLIAHLETYATSKGIGALQLAASPEGLAFYYKNGWEKIKDFIIEYHGVGFEETLMTKKISS